MCEETWNFSGISEFKFSIFTGNQEDYEYLRKFSSNDDSVNHSSPTSTFQYPYVHSQIDKNGKTTPDFHNFI